MEAFCFLRLFLSMSNKIGGVPMNSWMFDELNRREFMKKTALTGAAAYLGIGSDLGLAAAEPPPETTTIRFQKIQAPCWVPQLVAEPLLREEGFKDISTSSLTKDGRVKRISWLER
jgi:hypothetical protein